MMFTVPMPMRVYLETDRLILRRFTTDDAADDAADLVELDSDPEVMRYLNGGRPTPPEAIRDEILPGILAAYQQKPDLGTFAAVEKATEKFIGWFGLSHEHEIGYRLRREAWGRGYATEGARALVRHGFAGLGLDRIWGQTMTVNTASRRVMEKAGLRYVRTFFADWPETIPGSEHGDVEYAVTRDDWTAQAADASLF